jgi:hypothetical protein
VAERRCLSPSVRVGSLHWLLLNDLCSHSARSSTGNGNRPGSAHRPSAAGNKGAARALALPSRLSKGAEMAGWIWHRTHGGRALLATIGFVVRRLSIARLIVAAALAPQAAFN